MKAIWAFEPFHQDIERVKGMHRLLSQLAPPPESIELGFVVTHYEEGLNTTKILSAKDRSATYPRAKVKEVIKRANLKISDASVHVIEHETRSVTEAVNGFLKVARSRKADLIALYTHARSGFKRFLLGSFAETAIHCSKTSVLVVNPLCKISPRIKKVVFATDFAKSDRKHLQQTIALCRHLKAHLTIIHHAEVIYGWSLDESNPEFHAYRRQVNKTLASTEAECRKAGLRAEVIINSDFIGTTDLILQTVEKVRGDLIVMSAKAGPALALIGGSVSRKVVRAAQAPVLILK